MEKHPENPEAPFLDASRHKAHRLPESNVRIVEQPDEDSWDELLRGHAEATFFHCSAWARVLARAYGYKPLYLVEDAGTSGCAVLPLMEVRSRLTGVRGVSLPFSDACAPLAASAEGVRSLIRPALELGRQRGWKHLEIRGGAEALDGAKPSIRYCAHTLDLTPQPQVMLARVRATVRTAIRKAEKSGVTTKIGKTMDAVDAFFRLNCVTRRKHGLPPQPLRFFRALHEHVIAQDAGFVALAERAGRPLAANLFVLRGTQAVYKYGASDPGFQHLRAANLAMWAGIKQCAQRLCTSLFLGRTNLEHEGLIRFKESWGARPWSLDYVRWDFAGERFVEVADRVSGWHNRLFRVLPASVSRLIGSLLYRHIG